jgi:Zn/Cd-binding protein ZinT
MAITTIILKKKADIKKMSAEEIQSYSEKLTTDMIEHINIQNNCKDFLDKDLLKVSVKHVEEINELLDYMSKLL